MYPFDEVTVKDCRIELPDCFDFNAARQLIRKIKAIAERELPATLHIDCRHTRHIDTAGLGSLLVIGDYIGANRTIRIEAANAQVGAMLAMARIEERLARRGSEAGQPDLRVCVACDKPASERCGGTLNEAVACPRTGGHLPGTGADRGIGPASSRLALA